MLGYVMPSYGHPHAWGYGVNPECTGRTTEEYLQIMGVVAVQVLPLEGGSGE